jgi:hypothetical protein
MIKVILRKRHCSIFYEIIQIFIRMIKKKQRDEQQKCIDGKGINIKVHA